MESVVTFLTTPGAPTAERLSSASTLTQLHFGIAQIGASSLFQQNTLDLLTVVSDSYPIPTSLIVPPLHELRLLELKLPIVDPIRPSYDIPDFFISLLA